MSSIRPMRPGDSEEVATLYLRRLRHKDAAPSPALVGFFRSFYCDGPFREPDIPSLVHTADDGRVTGFVGVNSVPLLQGERKLRAAFCGSLVVEHHPSAPLAGASLLKAVLAGPQDVSMSETASPVAQGMWERLRGQVLAQASSSLDWVRVLRPAAFALAAASRKRGRLNALAPLAGLADGIGQRRARGSNLARFLPEPAVAGLAVQACGQEEFLLLLRQFTQHFAVRPDWSDGYGEHVVAEALDKPDFGAPVMAAVRARGVAVGAFLYHAAPGGIGRVLQTLAAPGRTGAVLQCLFNDAFARGVAGLRGRSDPAILKAAPGRSLAFTMAGSTVVHARDPQLFAVLQSGEGFLNGLAGETWCRLFGGALD